eukprot:6212111-Pleurochrysis_carterae.AAC.9
MCAHTAPSCRFVPRAVCACHRVRSLAEERTRLLGGQPVRLVHKEVDGFVACDRRLAAPSARECPNASARRGRRAFSGRGRAMRHLRFERHASARARALRSEACFAPREACFAPP